MFCGHNRHPELPDPTEGADENVNPDVVLEKIRGIITKTERDCEVKGLKVKDQDYLKSLAYDNIFLDLQKGGWI